MKLRLEQLSAHLQKSLAPIYFISGDVPLLIQEACNAIRQQAQIAQYFERQTFQVDNHFSWDNWLQEINNLSLFSNKRLVEIRLTSNKLNEAGTKAIQRYISAPSANSILLIIAGKLDSSAQKTRWFQALEQAGICIQVWPIEPAQMPQWINQRLHSIGIKATPAGVKILADLVEGNLLAAAQEIEKLYLLYGPSTLTDTQITEAVVDSARFDVFNLVDGCLAGDSTRTIRIMRSLQGTGTEPSLILWALLREIRNLIAIATGKERGEQTSTLFRQLGIWEKRQPIVLKAQQRHSKQNLYKLLQLAGNIDAIIKGAASGNCWNELLELSLALSGANIIKNNNEYTYHQLY